MTITWTLKISKFHSCVFGNLSLNISITYEWLFPYLGLILSIKFIIIYLRLCKMITLRIHVEAMERIKNYHILDLARTIVASARVIALSTSAKKKRKQYGSFFVYRILLSVKFRRARADSLVLKSTKDKHQIYVTKNPRFFRDVPIPLL